MAERFPTTALSVQVQRVYLTSRRAFEIREDPHVIVARYCKEGVKASAISIEREG